MDDEDCRADEERKGAGDSGDLMASADPTMSVLSSSSSSSTISSL